MNCIPSSIEKLARELNKLPGMGIKTATRLAFHIVDMHSDGVEKLSDNIVEAKKHTRICSSCFGYAESSEECVICKNPSRDSSTICVVERPQDVFTVERGGFRGLYHVLHGLVSPLDGVGPDKIKIRELVDKIKSKNIKEVVIALNPSVEGDATALFIAKELHDLSVKMSRLARGVPAGANMDYVDDVTLSRALEERQEIVC
jgi:recombination protein RecR